MVIMVMSGSWEHDKVIRVMSGSRGHVQLGGWFCSCRRSTRKRQQMLNVQLSLVIIVICNLYETVSGEL